MEVEWFTEFSVPLITPRHKAKRELMNDNLEISIFKQSSKLKVKKIDE